MAATTKDYVRNNNRLMTVSGTNQKYEVLDFASRTTTIFGKSPRVNGKLVIRQNPVSRTWLVRRGSGIHSRISQTFPGQPESVSFYSEGGYGPPDFDTTLIAELTSSAQTDALERFRSDYLNNQMQLMEYILERESTKGSIISAFQTIIQLRRDLTLRRLYKTLRIYNPRTRRVEPKRVEMSLHEKWLAYNFFWAPLLNDIHTLFRGMEPVTGMPIRKRASRSKTTFEQLTYPTSKHTRSLTHTVRVSVTGSVTITDPLLAILDELGLANPAKIVWNAVPFSFVVDWFINIGALADQVCSPGRVVTDPSITTLVSLVGNTMGSSTRKAPKDGSVATVGTGYNVYKATYNRTPGALPWPDLAFRGGIDSVWRAATSISLIRMLGNTK